MLTAVTPTTGTPAIQFFFRHASSHACLTLRNSVALSSLGETTSPGPFPTEVSGSSITGKLSFVKTCQVTEERSVTPACGIQTRSLGRSWRRQRTVSVSASPKEPGLMSGAVPFITHQRTGTAVSCCPVGVVARAGGAGDKYAKTPEEATTRSPRSTKRGRGRGNVISATSYYGRHLFRCADLLTKYRTC